MSQNIDKDNHNFKLTYLSGLFCLNLDLKQKVLNFWHICLKNYLSKK